LQQLREKQREDRTTRIRLEAKERRNVRAQSRTPTWQGWLEAEAARGNETALAAVRSRARRREPVAAQLLAAERVDEVWRDGRVIYQLSDGSAVSDEAAPGARQSGHRWRSVLRAVPGVRAVRAAPACCEGNERILQAGRCVAGQKELAVTFADPKLEAHWVIAGFEHARADTHSHDHDYDNGLDF